MHPLQKPAVLGAGGADVDARGVDAAVSQQVGQLRQILVQPVERPGEQVAEVMGKHLLVGDTGGAAQRLHLPPDVAAIQRCAGAGDKHGAAGDAALLDVAQQLILQAGGQDHPAGLALAADDGHATAGGLGGDGGQLADADTGGADRLQHQRQTGAACLPGGADKGGVLLRGDLPLLRRVGLVLDAQTAHTAVLPVEQAQKAVQRGQDGVDTVGGVVLCQVGLVVQHSVVGQGRVTQPLGEAADVAPVALQCGGGFFLVPQRGEEVVELCGGNGHGGASLYIK